jgi:putative hydrolase of the HAD superfamily
MTEKERSIGVSAYIFDYGGTLDTGGDHWARVLWRCWQEAGVPVDEATFREAYVYGERFMAQPGMVLPHDGFLKTLGVKLAMQLDKVQQPQYASQLIDMVYEQTLQHVAHSREVLATLKEHCPLALVSNYYGNLSAVLRELQLDGLFSTVVESAVVGVRKPDPRIFQLAVDRLGLPPAAITVVGDSIESDIMPARQVGCRTVWLRGKQWTEAPVDETLPDRIISDLEELVKK